MQKLNIPSSFISSEQYSSMVTPNAWAALSIVYPLPNRLSGFRLSLWNARSASGTAAGYWNARSANGTAAGSGTREAQLERRRLWNARRASGTARSAILYCLLAGDIISVPLSSGTPAGLIAATRARVCDGNAMRVRWACDDFELRCKGSTKFWIIWG